VQLLGAIKRVFERAALPLWISPHHQVLVVGKHAAIVETIPDVKSLHQHKKTLGTETSMAALFRASFKEGREYEVRVCEREMMVFQKLCCLCNRLRRRTLWRVWPDTAALASCSKSRTVTTGTFYSIGETK
jgi:hypothetical protein